MTECNSAREFLEGKVKMRQEYLEELMAPLISKHDDILKEFDEFSKALLRAKRTGNFRTLSKFCINTEISEKENSCPNTATNNEKLKKIKTEKLSIEPAAAANNNDEMPAPVLPVKKKRVKKEKESLVIKKESVSDTGKVTRSKTSIMSRDSDVILEAPSVPVINLSDSIEEKVEAPIRSTRTRTKKKANQDNNIQETNRNTEQVLLTNIKKEPSFAPARTTRTKTREATKRNISESDTGSRSKRSRSDSDVNNELVVNTSGQTEYEDAVSHVETKSNETFITDSRVPSNPNQTFNVPPVGCPNVVSSSKIMDQTVVIDKSSKPKSPPVVQNGDDLMTDDESIDGPISTSDEGGSNKRASKKSNPKEMASAYKSPVKKIVAVFENYKKDEVASHIKANTSRILKAMGENKGNVKEMAKTFTPISSKTLYSKGGSASASNIGRYIKHPTPVSASKSSSKGVNSLQSMQHKQSRSDFREKEQKKKDDLIAAKLEERRKKYDEKLLKIQKQKEASEREKEKVLEAQRLKDERAKQLRQQKEEKQRLMKEENQRKRLLAKQRAEEMKNKEEALRKLATEKPDQEQPKKLVAESLHKKAVVNATNAPIYMLKSAPYLLCDDCYDSDDDEYRSTRSVPGWATDDNVRNKDVIQTALGYKIKNTLFCVQNHTVDLREIFQKIDPRKLKRTSSANWERPPRYTLLSTVNED